MLESLFTPKTIAIIGASRVPGKFGHTILANLINGGFAGEILPVNPNADEILGLPCLPEIKASTKEIDLSIIIVAQPLVLQAVNDSIDAGVRAIIINSTGFKEASENGAELEEKIASICTARQIILLGPNCLGIINTGHRLNALYANEPHSGKNSAPQSGSISMISQSSTICTAFLKQMKTRNLGVAKVVNTGNKAQLSEIDFLKALGQDDQTKIITAFLENISSGDEFVKNAEGASLNKPVIILKSATSEAGRRAAAAHNGAVVSTDTAYGAAFKRAGIIRAQTFDDMIDLSIAFTMQPLPSANGVMVITNAGAPGIMAVDAISNSDLKPSYLSPKEATALHSKLPEAATVYNPIDILTNATPAHYELAIQAAMASDNINALIIILVDHGKFDPKEITQAIIKNSTDRKPLFVSFFGGKNKEISALLQKGSIPEFRSPEQAVNALNAMHEYVTWKLRPPRVVTRFPVNRRRVERIISRKLRAENHTISEAKTKDILQAYDFKVPTGGLALNADEAVDIANQIGYPVVMKIVSGDIIHKSDIGGIKLNLTNRQDVIDAYDLMMLRVAQHQPQALATLQHPGIIEGIYIEKMLDGGMEIALGMNRDPRFGPMLMFGLGLFVEKLKDVAFHLAPITFSEAVQMLTSTRSYKTMLDIRGKDKAHLTAIAQCLQKISQLSTDFPQISELEISPLIIGEQDSEPVVASARLKLKPTI